MLAHHRIALNEPRTVVLTVHVVEGDARLVDVLVVSSGERNGRSLVRMPLEVRNPRDRLEIHSLMS